MAKPIKKRFEVTEQQTIDTVLNQMKEEGYMPVRRMEEPIFTEKKENGSIQIIPYGKKIVFEGKLI
ncbi:NETI motif-containing protein [Bacillus atrophaeus]|uniref:NETI motif-containing protein n=1 Tax=Bacillus atrophaeus TaxID=1452 RepID=UPI00227EDB02|nr:NETI motif-containing protein [Bacillus atrophaeus]MCY8836708.1 NETI motif-containing protein [Bacillus atrophaeus]MED4810408.1 NETI motif-containing protein [Bacillus atrophaeus]MED4860189.1 NETI motif-containing protein [Bacillus atrophaeus]